MEKLTFKEISVLFRRGKRCRGKLLDILWMPSDRPKATVLITKGIKGAVVRNRTRRRVKEGLRSLLPGIGSCCLAVVVKEEGGYWELYRELRELLRSVGSHRG